MKTVTIESPYAGDIALNTRYVRAAMADCLSRGESPYASHALLTQPGVLNDNIPEERRLGIEAGLAMAARTDLRVVYTDLGISDGMKEGIKNAERAEQEIEYRTLPNFTAIASDA